MKGIHKAVIYIKVVLFSLNSRPKPGRRLTAKVIAYHRLRKDIAGVAILVTNEFLQLTAKPATTPNRAPAGPDRISPVIAPADISNKYLIVIS